MIDLKNKDYIEINQEYHKKIALDILIEFHNFCKKENLTYFLGFGTLLGAVRHKGFIPWDDDIDIFMPRPDYEKFLDVYKSDEYEISSPRDKHPLFTYSKLFKLGTLKIENGLSYKKRKPIGIDIDIFPIDGVNAEKYLSICNKIKKYNFLFQITNQNIKRKSFIKSIISFFIHCIRGKYICNKIENLKKRYDYNQWDNVSIYFAFSDQKPSNSIVPRYVFEKDIDVEFEGYKFKAPIGYDKLLTILYGDYMTPPPVDERITHHANKVYIKR